MGILRSNLSQLSAQPTATALHLTTRRRPRVHIDMTPMVDVAFLLVIFFMVTTLLRKPQVLDLDLPPVTQSAEPAEGGTLSVKVRHDGRIFCQVGADVLQPVADENALRTILAQQAALDPKSVVIVKVDREAPYRKLVDVLDELSIAKLSRVAALPLEGPERDEVEGIGPEGVL